MKGATFKRCQCAPRRNAQGKRLACPKRHGSWGYVVDVPLSEDGRKAQSRPRITRTGFSSDEAAAAEMRCAIQLLELPPPGDDAGHLKVAELIREHYKQFGQLPPYDEVRRRFTIGLEPVPKQTVGEYLDKWLAGKRTIAANTYRSYESHIRLYLAHIVGGVRTDGVGTRQEPRRRGHDRPPRTAGSGDLTAESRELTAQHEDLRVLRRCDRASSAIQPNTRKLSHGRGRGRPGPAREAGRARAAAGVHDPGREREHPSPRSITRTALT